jgi:hypothetical protein
MAAAAITHLLESDDDDGELQNKISCAASLLSRLFCFGALAKEANRNDTPHTPAGSSSLLLWSRGKWFQRERSKGRWFGEGEVYSLGSTIHKGGLQE